MKYLAFISVFAMIVVTTFFTSVPGARTQAETTPAASLSPTPFVPDCLLEESPTPTPAEMTPEATQPAQAPTVELTPTVALITTPVPDAPLTFTEFFPDDIKFNPDMDNPFAVIMVFTLVFRNEENTSLEVSRPLFRLAIESVPWGDLASTDFQVGRLQTSSSMGIVLQSLTIMSKTTDAQKAVLECIKAGRPVDLELTGTLDAYPQGKQQTLNVWLLAQRVVMQSRHPSG